tara:strand:+ start:264 stop:533 length:270 start_codon:yes stop_codon:yes gene_type:complete
VKEKTSLDLKKDYHSKDFVDPIRKPWVGGFFLVLLLLMLPVWPVEGNWLGIPSWSLFALLAGFLTSAFTAFIILRVWKDPDESLERTDD